MTTAMHLIFLGLCVLLLPSTQGTCGGCSSGRVREAPCRRVKAEIKSTTTAGSWWRKGSTIYKTVYKREVSCCAGYTLKGQTCELNNGCGGCLSQVLSNQPPCTARVTRQVSYKEGYSCGWWRTCYRTAYRTEVINTERCCDGYTLRGGQCERNARPTTTVPPQATSKCGVARAAPAELPQIIGGVDAEKGEFPWMVSVRRNYYSHICGGTLIGKRWILTAAHCVENSQSNPSNIKVRVGERIFSQTEHTELTLNVESIVLHPSYNRDRLINDIALLKTTQDIVYTDYVTPACLPKDSSLTFVGTETLISGWGRTNPGTPDVQPELPLVLQKAYTVVKPYADCSLYYASRNNVLCVSDKEDGRTTSSCFGDSGGPMLLKKDGVSTVIGVASFVYRTGCAMGVPFGYINVASFIAWINSVTG